MLKLTIYSKSGQKSTVLLLERKGTGLYSFVNITKGHICPCVFNSIESALEDLESYISSGKILGYDIGDFSRREAGGKLEGAAYDGA